MSYVTLPRFEEHDQALHTKLNELVDKVTLFFNGGITTANLAPGFTIPVEKITGALAADGSKPLLGNLETNEGVKVGGVDLSLLEKQIDAIIDVTRQEETSEQSVSIDMLEGHLSVAGQNGSNTVQYPIEFIVPTGYDGRNCEVLSMPCGVSIGYSVNTKNAWFVVETLKVAKTESTVTIFVNTKLTYEPTANDKDGKPYAAIATVKAQVRFWKRGLDV